MDVQQLKEGIVKSVPTAESQLKVPSPAAAFRYLPLPSNSMGFSDSTDPNINWVGGQAVAGILVF